MKKFDFILFVLALPVCCQLTFSQAGQSGLTFLKLGIGGRALGMGEAATATASDLSTIYYNPAGLVDLSSANILVMHKEWFQDVKTEYIAGQTVISRFSLGLSVNATSVDNIQLREIPGPPLGTFDARNAAIGLTIAYAADSCLSFGFTGKYLYEKILIDQASGFGIDIGSVYKTPWDLYFGLSVSNLGSVNELQNESSALPTIIRGGVAYISDVPQISGSLTVAGDLVRFSQDKITHLHIGAEYSYDKTLFLRAGYQTGYEARSVTAGIGFHYTMFQIDYAFIPTRYDLGSTHTFSLGIAFQ